MEEKNDSFGELAMSKLEKIENERKTEERDKEVKDFFTSNPNIEVIIEGPVPGKDRSYKWIVNCEDLGKLEAGIPLDDFIEEIQNRIPDMEFRIIRRITETQFHVDDLYECEGFETSRYNRYNDILPYTQTQVVLPSPDYENPLVKSSYINANFIHGLLCERKNEFIATQGPLKTTIDAFWQMIFLQNVKVIFMLCQLTVNEKSQCEQYWPQEVGQNVHIKHGNFDVSFIGEQDLNESIKKRTFQLSLEDNTVKDVVQYQFHNWDDDAAIPSGDLISLECLIEITREEKTAKNNPILVHCSAGVGRTGTFIAICNIIFALEELIQLKKKIVKEANKIQEDDAPEEFQLQVEKTYKIDPRISVFGTVRKLREQRWSMVKTKSQYHSIYEFMKFWITNHIEK